MLSIIFSVVLASAYGAVGDGVTDNAYVLASAVEASVQDGSREVEVGPGVYCLYPRNWNLFLGNPGRLASLWLPGVRLRGQGEGSTTLKMCGNGRNGDVWMLALIGDRTGVSDMTLDGSGRTGGYSPQQHLVQVYQTAKHWSLERLWVTLPEVGPSAGGDCIRLLGGYGEEDDVEDGLIRDIYAINCDRTSLSLQRGVHGLLVDNFVSLGAGDGDLDMEPTDVSTPGARIRDVLVTGFVARRTLDHGGVSIAMGRGDRLRVVDALIYGGTVFVLSCVDCEVSYSTIVGDRTGGAVIDVRRSSADVLLRGLRVSKPDGALRGPVVKITADSDGIPARVHLSSSTVEQPTTDPGLLAQGAAALVVDGNHFYYTGTPGHRDGVGVAVDATYPSSAAVRFNVFSGWTKDVKLSPGVEELP